MFSGKGGITSSGIGLMKGVPFRRALKSALAATISSGLLSRSTAVLAITLATCSMPLWAAGNLPWATSCQEWPGVPIA